MINEQSSNDEKKQIPKYKEITNIKIEESVLNKLLNFNFSSSSSNNEREGILFGRESKEEIIVSSFVPYSLSQSSTNLISYLETNRLDYMKVGFFTVCEESEFISQTKLRAFIDFQRQFPNSVILSLDLNMKNAKLYPFKCYRVNNNLIDMIDLMEIEDDIFLTPSNADEFYAKVFKKYAHSKEILKNLKFSIVENEQKLFKILAQKNNIDVNDFDNDECNIEKGIQQYNCKYALNKKMTELNKNCEKFIEEQKKYINYYKIKKNYGKNKEKEFIEQMSKKGSDLYDLDKMEISLNTKNIQNINEQIKNMLKKNEINNFTNFNLNKE